MRNIRPYQQKDRDRVTFLWNTAFFSKSGNSDSHIIAKHVRLYVVEENAVVLGVIGYKQLMRNIAMIGPFVIDKKYRNQGLGSALLKYLLRKLAKLGFRYIILFTKNVVDSSAIKLYIKFGFKIIDTTTEWVALSKEV